MIAEHQMDKCLTTECIFVFGGLSADCLRFSLGLTSRGQSPVVSFTTEHAETGFAGRGRRWEVFASRSQRPFARGAGDAPVLDPKGFLRTDFPRPAKRVSVCSAVLSFTPPVMLSVKNGNAKPLTHFPYFDTIRIPSPNYGEGTAENRVQKQT